MYLLSVYVVFVAIVAFIISVWFFSEGTGKRPCSVLLAVLSARENQVHRSAARGTWMRDVASDWCPVFVVGSTPCYVHPVDRDDKYNCKSLNLTIRPEQSFTTCNVALESTTEPQIPTAQFPFKVNIDIVVHSLGVIAIPEPAFPVTVALFDSITQAKICGVAIRTVKSGVNINGYLYRLVESCALPTGFEGILRLEASDPQLLKTPFRFNVIWDSGGHVISFRKDFDDRINMNRPSAVSFRFSIAKAYSGLAESEEYVRLSGVRSRNWSEEVAVQEAALKREAEDHEDMLFVDVTDVYRNIPNKLLSFYERALHLYNFDYLLKTDDDTLLNVNAISKALRELKVPNKLWWGRFRVNWEVYRAGKWAEHDYHCVAYPPFACGVAYLLSSDLVQYLASNKHHLHTFQGEDTSTGIWLAAVHPNYKDDSRWDCGDGLDPCRSDSLSLGQLGAEDAIARWKLLKRCNSLCENHCNSLK